ncbi:MAG: hypothetical protein CM15mV23_0850 [Eurybiavirus sp.]|nr:MAG: hypothetical protein CM15mV23_0850 [Eurybiavirus sp.]
MLLYNSEYIYLVDEKPTTQVNLYYLWYYHRYSSIPYSTSVEHSLHSMKQFNTWVLDTTIYILDFLYRGRDFQRFWVLEVIARAPYFSFISVLHFRESLGLRGEDHIYLMKEHFYQALNETEHLEEMERRGGDQYWIDRFFAKHLVLVYYWIMVGYYLADPSNAYDINMKIEKHAFETYTKYSAWHPEDKKIQEIAQDELNHAKELQHAMMLHV